MDKTEALLVKRIVFKLYNRYCPRGESGVFTRDDIYHYGIIGLLKAKKSFKPSMNVPFNAYAAVRIQGEIIDAVRKSPMVRIPQEKCKLYKMLTAAKTRLLNEGKHPSVKDLAEALEWTEDEVRNVERYFSPVMSIDAGPGYRKLPSHLSDGDGEKKVLNRDLSDIIQSCLERLEDVSMRIILIARELKNVKLRQLADQFGWSIEKVRQKQIRAKESMKKCLEKNGWDLT